MLNCPNCGANLGLSLTLEKMQSKDGDSIDNTAIPKGNSIHFTMYSKHYVLNAEEILEAAQNLGYPGTIQRYFVVIPDKNGESQHYPIKRVVRKALKIKYPSEFKDEFFHSGYAKNILSKLGFKVRTMY